MRRTFLLTGGTGFLGSRLSVALLERGDRVVFLGRSKNKKSLAERVHNNLTAVDSALISQSSFDVLEVDLSKPDLGLPPTTTDRLRKSGVAGIWHAAADLSFEAADRGRVFLTNVLGTRNVLAFSQKIGSALYHVSTAYVHGERHGHILESDLIQPKYFNNAYEESKFEAEKLLRTERSMQRWVIFRPSILVGQTTTDKLSALGYYAVLEGFRRCKLRLLRQVRRENSGSDAPLRFPVPMLCSRNSRLNLMPSDIATSLMLEIADDPESVGETFHITNPAPFSMTDVVRQTFEALELDTTIIRAPRWMAGMYLKALTQVDTLASRLPATFVRRLELYGNYMMQNNTYDMQNTRRIVGEPLAAMFQFNGAFVRERALEFLAGLQQEKASIRRAFDAARQRIGVPVENSLL